MWPLAKGLDPPRLSSPGYIHSVSTPTSLYTTVCPSSVPTLAAPRVGKRAGHGWRGAGAGGHGPGGRTQHGGSVQSYREASQRAGQDLEAS